MATHSSILAWRIPWTEEPGGLQSRGSQRVGYDWVTYTHTSDGNQNYLQREWLVSQTWPKKKKKKGKGEVFPEITKAAPGPSPSPQDHAAKLKEGYLQRPLTPLRISPPQSPDGGKVFPLLEVSSSPGHGRGWREAARGLTWPIQWPVEGSNDIIVKGRSKVRGWDGGTPVEMQMFCNPDSEFTSKLCKSCGDCLCKRRWSTKELMLLNSGAGEDSWQSPGLQGDQTSQS